MAEFHAGTTQKLTKADGTTGLVNFGSPHVNISRVNESYFFQSQANTIDRIDDVSFTSYWFDYLSVSTSVTYNNSISLPSRSANYVSGSKKSSGYYQPYFGVTEYNVYSHGLGYVPVFMAFDQVNARPIGGMQIYTSGNSYRFLSLAASSTNIYLREAYGVYDTNLPAVSFSLDFLIFDQGLDQTFTYSGDGLYISPTRAVFGQGKFDTDYNYVYQDAGSNFRLSQQGGIINTVSTNSPYIAKIEIYEDSSLIYNYAGAVNPTFATWATAFEDSSCTGTTTGVSLP